MPLIPVLGGGWPEPLPAAQGTRRDPALDRMSFHGRATRTPTATHTQMGMMQTRHLTSRAHLGMWEETSPQRKPTQTWKERASPVPTEVPARNRTFFLLNVITKWPYWRTCCPWIWAWLKNQGDQESFPRYTRVKAVPSFAGPLPIFCLCRLSLLAPLPSASQRLAVLFALMVQTIHLLNQSPPRYILDTAFTILGLNLKTTETDFWQWSDQLIPSISSLIKSSLPQLVKATLLKCTDVKKLKMAVSV